MLVKLAVLVVVTTAAPAAGLLHTVYGAGAVAAPPAAPVAERAEAWIRAKRKEKYFSAAPGISVLTVDPASGARAFGDGVQRHGGDAVADANTLYEIGSLSKTMTTLGLSALVARGVLSFDDRVQKWLGTDFRLGPHDYVSATVTVRDLLAHRTGLAEGQGDSIGSFLPTPQFVHNLADVDPVHSLRDVFQYSNTGWMLAGEVLRAASTGAESWCAALHAELLKPLGLNATFCHRNEIPTSVAAVHLADVHKHDPCGAGGPEGLATFSFTATGGPTDYAWGAADAAGSVVSSANDMATVLNVLLNHTSSPLLPRVVLDEIMTGQMVVGEEWMRTCGVATDGYSPTGRGNSAGLGFDLACEVSPMLSPNGLAPSTQPYVEKNGDTNMHKARMGLLPSAGAGTLLLSNLGGSMGCQLTALKFGVLTLLAGGDEADADQAAQRSLATTDYINQQWVPGTTCTACGRAAASGSCSPSGASDPPFALAAMTGAYTSLSVPFGDILVSVPADSNGLHISMGPVQSAPLLFSNTSAVVTAACSQVAAQLPLAPWARLNEGAQLAALPGNCSAAEFILPAEIPAAGISATNGTVAFPWGCGLVPLPDGMQVVLVAHNGSGVMLSTVGEAAWAK